MTINSYRLFTLFIGVIAFIFCPPAGFVILYELYLNWKR